MRAFIDFLDPEMYLCVLKNFAEFDGRTDRPTGCVPRSARFLLYLLWNSAVVSEPLRMLCGETLIPSRSLHRFISLNESETAGPSKRCELTLNVAARVPSHDSVATEFRGQHRQGVGAKNLIGVKGTRLLLAL